LNADGCHTPTGGRFYQGYISRILENPTYAGLVEINGEITQGTFPEIIDQATRQAALSLRRSMKETRRGRAPRAHHLLGAGLLRCPGCGSTMRAVFRTDAKGAIRWEAYQCSRKVSEGVDACSVTPLEREPIDRAVYEWVVNVAVDIEATEAVLIDDVDARLAENQALLAQAERDAMRVERDRAKVKRDYLDGDDSVRNLLAELNAELVEEAEGLASNIKRLKAQGKALQDERTRISTDVTALAELTEARTEIIRAAMEGSRQSGDAFRVILRRLFVMFQAIFPGEFPHCPKGAEDSIAWVGEDGLTVGNLILLPRVRPDAIDFQADHIPAFHRVPLVDRTHHAAKLALLYDLERVPELIRGHEPFHPDRDRAVFARFLIDSGCQPPPGDRPPDPRRRR
jgi:Recombinase zinc beta ribbon domain/Recombinase